MESRKEFEERICDYAKKEFFLEKKFFETRPSVKDKVDKNNHFSPYYGDTIVFNLKETYKEKINAIVLKLYEVAPECFCDRLNIDTLHLTLHDLSSSKNADDILEDVAENAERIRDIFEFIQICPTTIRMKMQCITNILNISLVLVFLPVDDKEYLKLMTLYNLFDGVRTLDYKLTPHVTLGYYNIMGFDVSSVLKLENLVNELNREEFEITLSTKDLFYQVFTNMNYYENINKFT